MKTRYFFALAAVVLLAGCNKEFQSPEIVITDARTTLEVGIAPAATKTYMGEAAEGERKVYWSNGDQVAVNGIASDALAGVEEGSASAQFTFQSVLDTPYNVLYPASAYVDASHINLPAVQDWDASGFADGFFPMAGYSEDGSSIQLAHLCSVLKIQVRQAADGDADKLVSVRFRGGNGEQVSGNFNIFYEKGALVGESTASADQVVMVVKSQATSVEEPVVYYVVVPAGTYSNGFAITVQDANGHIMTKTKPSSMELEPGRQYNMPAFEFVPTGTELGIEISSAAELVAFAQAYNNKTFAALGSSLVATLTADLTFDATTSAAFNATGGIGLKETYGDAEDYYFDGLFNGNGYNIQGLKATAPIFKATSSSGKIANLIVDSSCSFTFTHSNEADLYFAAVAGYHKGVIDNVNVKANVALAAGADIAKLTALGGVAGRITTGSVSNCSYSGAISVPAEYASSAKILVGGLAGYMSNTNGSVTDSSFDGTIEFAGTGADKAACNEDKNNPFVVIGGVVGYKADGTVSNCTTSDHPVIAGAYSGTAGTIVDNATTVWITTVGGIVGENIAGAVSNCTNGAQILNTIFKADNSDDKARRIWTGGIVGVNRASGTVTECLNDAALVHRSNPRLQSFGGVVGYNLGTVTSCSNAAALSIGTTGVGSYSARCPNFGGIIGENAKTAVVSDVHNTGDLLISRTENTTGTEVRMGGVIGSNYAAIDGGASKNITNSGKVYFNTNLSSQAIKYSLGGIVGYSEASVYGASNSGYILFNWNSDNAASLVYLGGVVGYMNGAAALELSGCDNIGGASNAGEVYFAVKVGSSIAHTGNYAGGILGYCETGVAISNCTNSGYVHGGNTKKYNGKTMYVGGIAAYIAGASSVSSCTNNGKVLNDQFNNNVAKTTATFEGGIVGMAVGTEDSRISLSNVTNDVTGVTTITGGRRGFTGGIVGYGEYVDIANASNADSYGSGSGWYIGGIAGWALNSTISGCSFTGTSISSSQLQANAGAGIVAKAEASNVSGCNSSISDIYHVDANGVKDANIDGGAIIGVADAGNTVSGCHYKAAINGAASKIAGTGEFTDGGGNVADL